MLAFQLKRNAFLCTLEFKQHKTVVLFYKRIPKKVIMNRFLAFSFFLAILLQSCNDGDIIITSFNFDDADLENCGQSGNYVFYKINTEAQESLSLKLGVTSDLYLAEVTNSYTLDGTSNFVNYRSYNGAVGSNYFCSSIPPTSPLAIADYLAAAGTAQLTTTFNYNDNDGVPTEDEFNGDTDGDGIPDIYDEDDDGDNVPTALELDILNEDGDDNPLTNPLDTDGDGIPDYLDDDDDGDGVLTRYEDKNMDLNPRNDVTNSTVGADYLNPEVADTYIVDEYAEHEYTNSKNLKIVLKNVVLIQGEEEITQETISMGTIENIEIIETTVTPEF